MDFLVAGLLVLDLAVTLVSVYLLRRKPVVNLCDVEKRLDMVARALSGNSEAVEKVLRTLQERDGQRITDAAQILTRLDALLEETSSRGDEEARHSRAIEEGVANLLSYSAGKGREAGT